jgi:hypothetical protein
VAIYTHSLSPAVLISAFCKRARALEVLRRLSGLYSPSGENISATTSLR